MNFYPPVSVALQGFVHVEIPCHLKALTRPTQVVPWEAAPWIVTKFTILKRFNVSENESIYQEYQYIPCKKLRKIWKYFTGISGLFRKIILPFRCSYKSEEISDRFYFLAEKSIKYMKNRLDRERVIEEGWNLARSDWIL